MALQLHHLDQPDVRARMLALWREACDSPGRFRIGSRFGGRLTSVGRDAWDLVFPRALTHHDDDWLVGQIDQPEYWLWLRDFESLAAEETAASRRLGRLKMIRRTCACEFNAIYVLAVAERLHEQGQRECLSYCADASFGSSAAAQPCAQVALLVENVIRCERERRRRRFGPWRGGSPDHGDSCLHSICALDQAVLQDAATDAPSRVGARQAGDLRGSSRARG
jgi:hypothetical protein